MLFHNLFVKLLCFCVIFSLAIGNAKSKGPGNAREVKFVTPKEGSFANKHLFTPSVEAKKDGRNWNKDPQKWTKKQWNTLFTSRAKQDPEAFKGRTTNTFIVARSQDFTKSVHKGELISKTPKGDLRETAGKFRTFKVDVGKKGVKKTTTEVGKVRVGVDKDNNPTHFEPKETINDNVKKLRNIKPKKNQSKTKVQRVAQAVRGGNKNSRRVSTKKKNH